MEFTTWEPNTRLQLELRTLVECSHLHWGFELSPVDVFVRSICIRRLFGNLDLNVVDGPRFQQPGNHVNREHYSQMTLCFLSALKPGLGVQLAAVGPSRAAHDSTAPV